jgi:uracil-DNA glycosylase
VSQYITFRTTKARQQYERLADEWSGCERCSLASRRTHLVHLRGTVPAQVLFIGEAPGHSEDSVGYPFVGDAGKILGGIQDPPAPEYNWGIIEAAQNRLRTSGDSRTRGMSFTWAIVNVVACLPEKFERGLHTVDDKWLLRQPTKEEALVCRPRLDALIELVKPHVVILLGRVAARFYKPPPSLPCLEVYHPAYILRVGGRARTKYNERCTEFKKTVMQIEMFLRNQL